MGTNWFVVYLISVMDGVQSAAVGLAIVSGMGLFIGFAMAPMFLMDLYRDEGRAEAKATVDLWRKRAVVGFCVGLGICAITPDVDSLMRAYVMVEGSKVVTAENAEKATAEIVKRVDKLIEAIAK